MKMIKVIVAGLVTITSLHCEKGRFTQVQPCDSSKSVSEFSDRIGSIEFDQNTGLYSISYHTPGTYDSVIKGIFCNLPEEFRKNGLAVKYSGTYKERDKDSTPLPAGYKIYTLELNQVSLINSY